MEKQLMIINSAKFKQLAEGEIGIKADGYIYKYVRTAQFPACYECILAGSLKCRVDICHLCSWLYAKRRPGNDFMPVITSTLSNDNIIDLDKYHIIYRI